VAKRLAIFPRTTHSNALGRVRAQGAYQSSHTHFDAEVPSPDFIYPVYIHKKIKCISRLYFLCCIPKHK
jgi:hypothetical protein